MNPNKFFLLKILFLVATLSVPAIPSGQTNKLSADQKEQLRSWIEALALETLQAQSERREQRMRRWGNQNRDCAGFLRYLIWESFQTHNSLWRNRFGGPLSSKLRDITVSSRFRKKIYARLWTNARDLIQKESVYIGRRVSSKLQTGDILYYELENERGRSQHHIMLLIQRKDNGQFWVVYHTGQPRNQIKAMSIKDLLAFKDTRWQPENMNPYFSGFYRLKILQE